MQIWKINGENWTQLTSQIPGILRIITARAFTLFNGIVILWSFHRFVWCARGTGRVSAKRFAAIEKILENANHPIYDNCQSAGDPTLGYLPPPPSQLTWSSDIPIYLGGEKAENTDVLPSGDRSLAKYPPGAPAAAAAAAAPFAASMPWLRVCSRCGWKLCRNWVL